MNEKNVKRYGLWALIVGAGGAVVYGAKKWWDARQVAAESDFSSGAGTGTAGTGTSGTGGTGTGTGTSGETLPPWVVTPALLLNAQHALTTHAKDPGFPLSDWTAAKDEDGKLGPRTKAAITWWQSIKGLTISGDLTRETYNSLLGIGGNVAVNPPASNTAASAPVIRLALPDRVIFGKTPADQAIAIALSAIAAAIQPTTSTRSYNDTALALAQLAFGGRGVPTAAVRQIQTAVGPFIEQLRAQTNFGSLSLRPGGIGYTIDWSSVPNQSAWLQLVTDIRPSATEIAKNFPSSGTFDLVPKAALDTNTAYLQGLATTKAA